MESHVTILAVLTIALGILGLGAALIVFVAIAGGGLISGDATAIAITSTVAVVIAGILFVISVPSLIAGVGLLKRANWARILTLVIAALNLANIPFGTAVGIYAFWVLLNEETARMFGAPQPGMQDNQMAAAYGSGSVSLPSETAVNPEIEREPRL